MSSCLFLEYGKQLKTSFLPEWFVELNHIEPREKMSPPYGPKCPEGRDELWDLNPLDFQQSRRCWWDRQKVTMPAGWRLD